MPYYLQNMEGVNLSNICFITDNSIDCLICKKSFSRQKDSIFITYCKCQVVRIVKAKQIIQLLLVDIDEHYEVEYEQLNKN
jgi:hypothetical protein